MPNTVLEALSCQKCSYRFFYLKHLPSSLRKPDYFKFFLCSRAAESLNVCQCFVLILQHPYRAVGKYIKLFQLFSHFTQLFIQKAWINGSVTSSPSLPVHQQSKQPKKSHRKNTTCESSQEALGSPYTAEGLSARSAPALLALWTQYKLIGPTHTPSWQKHDKSSLEHCLPVNPPEGRCFLTCFELKDVLYLWSVLSDRPELEQSCVSCFVLQCQVFSVFPQPLPGTRWVTPHLHDEISSGSG